MGADGGVCWMPLRDPDKYHRVRELLKPFYELTEFRGASWQEDADSEWLDKNRDISAPCYLVGTYGTSQDHDLAQLREILLCEKEELCIDASLSFTELVLDLETRPLLIRERYTDNYITSYLTDRYFRVGELRNCYYGNCQRLSDLEIMLWGHLSYKDSLESKREILGDLADMNVLNWQEELKSLLNYENVWHVETWT